MRRRSPFAAAFAFAADPPDRLVGIAKLAADSNVLENKRRVEYRDLETRRYIGRCSGTKPFDWTINPYRGCEFGCKYCYARYAHEFMELRDPRQFEEIIFAKSWNETEFRRELDRVPKGQAICLGTATDPYQPAERRFGITRRMLKVVSDVRGHRLWITTKSDLVTRDLDILRIIGLRNIVQVSITVTTVDDALARKVEPYAPRPALRLAAVKKLNENGIRAGVLSHPIMPLINDSERSLDRLAKAAAEAKACFWSAAVLFLKPCAQGAFFPFLEADFPHLVRRYRERFEKSAYLKGEYPQLIKERVERLREKYGFGERSEEYTPELWLETDQMSLF
jgi:DNA repair photolyase